MMRRQIKRIVAGPILALCLTALPALAQNYAQSIITQLREQGYVGITLSKTFLGRIRILARQNGGWREIVINPRTGEVLRDVWSAGSDTTSPRIRNNSGGGTSGGGTGGGDDGSGGDDGDGHDNGGDDNDDDGGDDQHDDGDDEEDEEDDSDEDTGGDDD